MCLFGFVSSFKMHAHTHPIWNPKDRSRRNDCSTLHCDMFDSVWSTTFGSRSATMCRITGLWRCAGRSYQQLLNATRELQADSCLHKLKYWQILSFLSHGLDENAGAAGKWEGTLRSFAMAVARNLSMAAAQVGREKDKLPYIDEVHSSHRSSVDMLHTSYPWRNSESTGIALLHLSFWCPVVGDS